MFIRIGRLEVWIGRCGAWSRDLLPKGAIGGDPVGKTAWLWWLGREAIFSWLPRRAPTV